MNVQKRFTVTKGIYTVYIKIVTGWSNINIQYERHSVP